MAYQRKTADEWRIWGNYGYGWDEVAAEETRAAARAQLACYRENEPRAVHKMTGPHRVPIGSR